jgi:hypothetical protein
MRKIKISSPLNILIIILSLITYTANSQDYKQDIESWNVVKYTNHFGEKWSVSLQEETRFQNDISKLNQIIVKVNATIQFSKKIGFHFGFKGIYRPDDANEWEPWQELLLPHSYKGFHVSHNVRLEERVYQGLDGILPRIRYLFNYNIPVGKKRQYIVGYGAVRFNLVNKGSGPVSGFEQVRLRAAYGFHIKKFMQLEIGYLYRYELNRNTPNLSDHVIHLQIPFTTGNKKGAAHTKKYSY